MEYETANQVKNEEEEEEERSLFDSLIIPNPILDQIDPEGAGERFGELARDPKFWFDAFLVLAIFNFCEYVAQVPYYDLT